MLFCSCACLMIKVQKQWTDTREFVTLGLKAASTQNFAYNSLHLKQNPWENRLRSKRMHDHEKAWSQLKNSWPRPSSIYGIVYQTRKQEKCRSARLKSVYINLVHPNLIQVTASQEDKKQQTYAHKEWHRLSQGKRGTHHDKAVKEKGLLHQKAQFSICSQRQSWNNK